jgi:hypothetical protein
VVLGRNLKNLKEKYKKSVSAIEQNFEIPAEEKAKQLKQLKANYKKQRIKARFSLFFK